MVDRWQEQRARLVKPEYAMLAWEGGTMGSKTLKVIYH